MRIVMICAAVVLLTLSPVLAADVDVYLPNVTVSPANTTCDLLVTARLRGGAVYDLDGYVMKVKISGGNGCVFSRPATQASSNYLLDQPSLWDGGTLSNGGRTLEQVTDMREEQFSIDASSGDAMRNVAILSVALSGVQLHDTFALSFDTANMDDTGIWNWGGSFYSTEGMPTVNWHGGSITVAPEPGTLVLLVASMIGLAITHVRREHRHRVVQ